jgi:phosphate:Na+ symporter
MDLIADLEIWLLLAGLGMFLFGMHMMEESVRILSGAAFRSLIRRYTGTRIKAILSGMISTAVLQSSSAVSLMVLAFIGAGVMNLVQAIAVMMGAKVGTTATAWLVAVFGFSFSIDSFTLPLIGIGGLGIILLARSPRYVNISKFLVAFGFLFMGLDYMKTSVEELSKVIDPAAFSGYGILVYAVVGMVLTAVMQSSSATIAIVLTLLFNGVLDFQSGAAMVIGANVGTTITVLLGSIGGTFMKKQAAVSQLLFTGSTAVVALILLPVLVWLILTGLGFQQDIILGMALFHTLVNVLGVMVFYPLIPTVARRAELWIPETERDLLRFIHKTDPAVEEAAIEAFRKEIKNQFLTTLRYMENAVLNGRGRAGGRVRGQISYEDLEEYNALIFEYYSKIQSSGLKESIAEPLEKLLRGSRNIMNAAKNMHESLDEFAAVSREPDTLHREAWGSIRDRIERLIRTGREMDSAESEEETAALLKLVEELFDWSEQKDKEFIRMCSGAVKDPVFRKTEITFLLMLNRLVTQSCRMMVYGMRALLKAEIDG